MAIASARHAPSTPNGMIKGRATTAPTTPVALVRNANPPSSAPSSVLAIISPTYSAAQARARICTHSDMSRYGELAL